MEEARYLEVANVYLLSWLDACTAAWLGACCLQLVQRCWPVLMGWHFLCVCALGGTLL